MTEGACRKIVADRSGGQCEAHLEGCLRRATSMHHRRKAGRDWTPSNVLHLCGDGTTGCHGRIEARPDLARARGLWVDSWQDPAEVPVDLEPAGLWRAWWRLDEEGDYGPAG